MTISYLHVRLLQSHPGQLIFLRKSDCFALFVCLTLLASFFLPSDLSLKHVHVLQCEWLELLKEKCPSMVPVIVYLFNGKC